MPRPTSSLRPRKRPLQARSVKTVSAILEAAAQVLEAGGLAAFNTNAVAERAGVSIGSLYQYFPDKDALLIDLMRREKERFRDDAARALNAACGRSAIEHLVGAAVRHQLLRPELARLLDIEERRPEAQREVAGVSQFRLLLRTTLDRPDLPKPADLELAADEIALLVQTLVDVAGTRLESDALAVERRVCGAVFGYLDGDVAAAKKKGSHRSA